MASAKALVIQAGITKQILDADILIIGAGIEGPVAGPISVGANALATSLDVTPKINANAGLDTQTAGIFVFGGSGNASAWQFSDVGIEVLNARVENGTAAFLEFDDGVTAAVSALGEGRLRYNDTSGTFQVSVNGGAYADIGAGGAGSLSATLAVGNTTGGNDIEFTSGDSIAALADGLLFQIAFAAPATAGAGGEFRAIGQIGAATFAGGVSRVVGGNGGVASGATAGGAGGAGRTMGGDGGAAAAGAGVGGKGGSATALAGVGGAGSATGVAGAGGDAFLVGGSAGVDGGAGGGAGGDIAIEAGAATGAAVNGTIYIGADLVGGATAAINIGNVTTNPPVIIAGSGGLQMTTDGFVKMDESAADPSTAANEGVIYTKDVAGATQLFYREDSDGAVYQITPGGVSSGSVVIAVDTATNTLLSGEAAYISASGIADQADAAAGAPTPARFAGFYQGNAGELQVAGIADVTGHITAALVIGGPVYVDITTPGNVTGTAPSVGGQFVAEVGLAVTATSVLIQPKMIIQL